MISTHILARATTEARGVLGAEGLADVRKVSSKTTPAGDLIVTEVVLWRDDKAELIEQTLRDKLGGVKRTETTGYSTVVIHRDPTEVRKVDLRCPGSGGRPQNPHKLSLDLGSRFGGKLVGGCAECNHTHLSVQRDGKLPNHEPKR